METDSNLRGEEYEGEKMLGEGSFDTPGSSPDTCVTSTLSCISTKEKILRGDFTMKNFKGTPQLTLAFLKPDGMAYIQEIERRMREEGFDIVQKRRVHLSPEQASDFYYEHYGQEYFPLLISSLCTGPIQVYVLRRKDAVDMWKITCGPPCVYQAKKAWPESLRAIYGVPGKDFKNVCHGSATEEKAREEIRFFFPDMVLDKNYLNKTNVEDFIQEYVNPTLLEGLTQVCKNKPLDPITWLATWLLMNNPFKPRVPEAVALTPT